MYNVLINKLFHLQCWFAYAKKSKLGYWLQINLFHSSPAPVEDDEDYIDMGGAILTFYAALVDLLGRCAPDAATINEAKSDSIRARAILRSLVSLEDLEGCLSLHFMLPNVVQPDIKSDGISHFLVWTVAIVNISRTQRYNLYMIINNRDIK